MTSEYCACQFTWNFGTQFCMQIPLHFKPFLAKPIQVSGSLHWAYFLSLLFIAVGQLRFTSASVVQILSRLSGHKTLERLFKAFGRPMKSSGHDFAEGEVCSWFWHSIECIFCGQIQLFPFMFQSHLWYIAFSHSANTIFPNSFVHYFLLPFCLNIVQIGRWYHGSTNDRIWCLEIFAYSKLSSTIRISWTMGICRYPLLLLARIQDVLRRRFFRQV